jgi:single-strand DNA-binding protein
MFNRFIGIGNLTKDPGLRYTPGGTLVATLSVAFNSKYSQNGEIKEEVLFLDAVVFGKQAESCKQYLNKGNPILVEGRLRESKWEHEGKPYRKVEIIASAVRFLPKREKAPNEKIEDILPRPEEITDLEPL